MIKRTVKHFISKFGLELSRKQSSISEKNKEVYATVGSGSNIKDVFLDVRNPEIGRKYFEIGNDSLITGVFVFEINKGKIKIGNRTFIGGGLFISIEGIEIGDDVMFSWGCTVMDNNAHSVKWKERKEDVANWKKGIEEGVVGKYKEWSNVKSAPIIIKDKVWIGFNVIILKGVTIGEGSIVGAGSVVVNDIPDWSIVAGNPAIVIKTIPEEER